MLRRAALWGRGRLEEAIGFCRRASEQDPLSAAAYFNLGVLLHAADRLTEAEAAYRKVLELTPQRTSAHAYLALTLLAGGRGSGTRASTALRTSLPLRSLHGDPRWSAFLKKMGLED